MNIQRNSPIGLIDSGIGGLSLLKPLVQKYTNENYVYLADNLYMPYGTKRVSWLATRVSELVKYLYNTFDVKLVILACNTASVATLEQINKTSPVKVVGLNINDVVTSDCQILCTKVTAKKYTNLNVYPCSKLASYIEDNFFDKKAIKRYLKRVFNKASIQENNIILGCTHYELIEEEFKCIMPNKRFVLPCKEFVDNFTLDKPNLNQSKGDILMISTLATKSYIDKLWTIFNN